MKLDTRMAFCVTADDHEALARIAAEQHRTMSQLCRLALRQVIEQNGPVGAPPLARTGARQG